ncbi:MAG: outer membrane protein assembly factor BamC [Porticoccaceae bacterium]
MKLIKLCVSVSLIITLSGCGWLGIRDRSNDYLAAQETEPTVIPAELDSVKLGQAYPIPQIKSQVELTAGFEVPRPQPISVNTFEQMVKIQSISDQRWILVNSAPSELWPRIRNALNRNGIPAARAEGSEGLIETIWLNFQSDNENSHRFQFSISPGVQINSTEISVLHHQVPRGEEEGSTWPDQSISDRRESDMLSLLANQLAAEPDYSSVSLLAQEIGGESKVDMVKPEVADPYLLVKLAFDRTWASVDYSASRGGFTTVDKNRNDGLLMVNYGELEEDDEQGFFASWFGDKGSEQAIIDANYQILVQTVGANTEVRIVDANGGSVDKPTLLKLLSVLRNNMT